MTAAALVLIAVSLGLVACDDGSPPDDASRMRCGLPTPEPGVDASLLPDAFLVEGTEVVKVRRGRDRLTAAINIQRSVEDSFKLYRGVARDAGFEVVGQDNEGFEAEVYMRKGKELGAIQIRTSTCSTASVVFVNIVRT